MTAAEDDVMHELAPGVSTMSVETTNAATLPDVLTPEDAAAYLRLPEPSVRALLRSGALPGARVGKLWRLRRSDLDAMFAAQNRTAPAPVAPAPADDPSADVVAPSVILAAPRIGRPGRKPKARRASAEARAS